MEERIEKAEAEAALLRLAEKGHSRPATARRTNAVRTVLLRTLTSEALAGAALHAEYLQLRGTPPTRPAAVRAAAPPAAPPGTAKQPSAADHLEPHAERPWEARLSTMHPSRAAALTAAVAAHVRASAEGLGLGADVAPEGIAKAKALLAAVRTSRCEL